MAFFHVPIKMSDPTFQNMCSLTHATSSSTMIMMLLINLDGTIKWRYGSFSDLLVWRIGLRKVRIFWSMVHYSTICPLLCTRWDLILYNVHLYSCHDSILFHMDMLIHCSTTWTIHSISDSSSICDDVIWCFPKVPCLWAHCLNILKWTSIIFKRFLVESIFNILF